MNGTVYVHNKPNRRVLLKGITRLQNLISEARGLHANDRDPNGFVQAQALLTQAHELCIELRAFDPPGEELK